MHLIFRAVSYTLVALSLFAAFVSAIAAALYPAGPEESAAGQLIGVFAGTSVVLMLVACWVSDRWSDRFILTHEDYQKLVVHNSQKRLVELQNPSPRGYSDYI